MNGGFSQKILKQDVTGLTYDAAQKFENLPLIPLPDELKRLPPLPKEQEEVLRLLARHAIQLIKENIKNDTLQTLTKGFKV